MPIYQRRFVVSGVYLFYFKVYYPETSDKGNYFGIAGMAISIIVFYL